MKFKKNPSNKIVERKIDNRKVDVQTENHRIDSKPVYP